MPPRDRSGDPESGPQLGKLLSLAQVNQHEQGLLSRVEQSPCRPDCLAVPTEEVGRRSSGLSATNRGQQIEQHPRPLAVTEVIAVINPSTRGFAMSSDERHSHYHDVISNPPSGDEIAQWTTLRRPEIPHQFPDHSQSPPSAGRTAQRTRDNCRGTARRGLAAHLTPNAVLIGAAAGLPFLGPGGPAVRVPLSSDDGAGRRPGCLCSAGYSNTASYDHTSQPARITRPGRGTRYVVTCSRLQPGTLLVQMKGCAST